MPENTVCLSRTASVGYVVMMGVPMATSQDFVNWVCGDRLNPHFLKYVLLLENPSFRMFSMGTTHQTIYFPEVKAFYIAMPTRATQDAIVEVLSALDDKIAINREMGATLETISLGLFRSWFLDFEPVHARAAGQNSGYPSNLAAMFPTAFGANGLPEGWRVGQLAYEFKLTMGQSPPGDTYNDCGEGLPFFQGSTDFEVRYPKLRKYCTAPSFSNCQCR